MKSNTEYKDFSLTKLEESVFDAMQSGATAEEVFNTIFNVVKEERNTAEERMGYAADLLAYLRSGGRVSLPKPETENYTKQQEREFNLKDQAHYDARIKLDADLEKIKEQGGYEWTPPTSKDEFIDRNDSVRLAYEEGWIYESPDGGKTVTKRRVGDTRKFPVKTN